MKIMEDKEKAKVNIESKQWKRSWNMAKRMIPGKTRKSKGKKVSHRPVRSEGVYFDENDHKWYKRVEE